MITAGLIVAAGRGTRATATSCSAAVPKQYQRIGGRPVLARTLEVFLRHPDVDHVLTVIHPDDAAAYQDCLADLKAHNVPLTHLSPPTHGADTRQASVLAGLTHLKNTKPDPAIEAVLIHDAARPFVEPQTIDGVIAALSDAPGAIAAEPLADTLKRSNADNTIAETIDRAGLWRAQTPQAFALDAILNAHCNAETVGKSDVTDDAALAEWAGLDVRLVTGTSGNQKLTTAQDMEMADQRLSANPQSYEFRTGSGYDVHRFADGDHLWLGGIKIAHDKTLQGHSDADVALHALTDALLGAIADGDIGTHFPPSDPAWKGARSDQFLADAARRMRERQGSIVNVDLTIICEAPKIGPHRDAIRVAIAEILQTTVDRVSVKATTSERLGFTGRGEGIAAMASATVRLPHR